MRTRVVLTFGLIAAGLAGCQGNETNMRTVGQIEQKDEALAQLIAADAKIEVLGEGYTWSEGPVWVADGAYLLFTDVPENVMYKWSEGDNVTEFLKPSGYAGPDLEKFREPGANGLMLDASGRLLMCDHGNRAIAALDLKTMEKSILVNNYQGSRFNSPNDLAIKNNGDIYFTDPPYGLKDINDSPDKELSFNGVYRWTPGGEAILLTDELTFPNGIAFSPDEQVLYVALSDPENPVLMAYDVVNDGGITNGRVFFDATQLQRAGLPGLPDGMAIDNKGNIFTTGPGGVLVLTPEGEHVGTISTGNATANCTFGEDGSTLFLTSKNLLCRVPTLTKGAKVVSLTRLN